jgi:hypothetical protein
LRARVAFKAAFQQEQRLQVAAQVFHALKTDLAGGQVPAAHIGVRLAALVARVGGGRIDHAIDGDIALGANVCADERGDGQRHGAHASSFHFFLTFLFYCTPAKFFRRRRKYGVAPRRRSA